jgi:hypothetical protein
MHARESVCKCECVKCARVCARARMRVAPQSDGQLRRPSPAVTPAHLATRRRTRSYRCSSLARRRASATSGWAASASPTIWVLSARSCCVGCEVTCAPGQSASTRACGCACARVRTPPACVRVRRTLANELRAGGRANERAHARVRAWVRVPHRLIRRRRARREQPLRERAVRLLLRLFGR